MDEENNDPIDADEIACGINYYEAGKTAGKIVSRFLMQKLEESRLP
jgi:ABC-type uncharacterized transport system substrate-binding protein